MGQATLTDVRAELERRAKSGEFIGVEQKTSRPGRAFTTQEMLDYERDTIQVMRDGQSKHEALVTLDMHRETGKDHSHLSDSQRAAADQILSSHDQVMALEGVAGAGKTTSLSAVRRLPNWRVMRSKGLRRHRGRHRNSQRPELHRARCSGIL